MLSYQYIKQEFSFKFYHYSLLHHTLSIYHTYIFTTQSIFVDYLIDVAFFVCVVCVGSLFFPYVSIVALQLSC